MRVYIGTYTHNTASEGIYRCTFDPRTGALALDGLAARAQDPSYLALHPAQHTLYACNELSEFSGQPVGAVSALAIDRRDGALALRAQQPSGGAAPCHVSVDRSGRTLLAANYGGGSFCVLPILPDGALAPDGQLHRLVGSGPDAPRQERPHAHSIWPDPTNLWALGCDLGSDRVYVYALHPSQARLLPARAPFARVQAGAGPRHIAFHPNGRWVYLLNELRSAVTLFDWDPVHGLLNEVAHTPALPPDFEGPNGAADIHLTPDGRYLYASNRGQDALACFAVDPVSGLLTDLGYAPTGGQHPRNFGIAPGGRWLLVANMHSNNIVTLAIDAASGALQPTGHVLSLPGPTCILFA
ncbi:MAG: lactonase family protein [Chloroflexi bacterium]|nr:lactonase family protein [Chloroflexota bacterium]